MEGESQKEPFADVIEELERIIDKLPDVVARNVRKEIAQLRSLIIDRRNPRFALVGRRGSGKSSLVNAIFGAHVAEVGHEKAQTGKGTWREYEGELGTIELLDTRGLQEGSRPDEEDVSETAEDSIAVALKEKAPDAILFLIKATEADAAIDGDLDGLEVVQAHVRKAFGFNPPILIVVTHCDQVEPLGVELHDPHRHDPRDVQEKLERIEKIERQVDAKVRSRPALQDHIIRAIGVSVYQSWRRDGSRRDDRRWRVEELATILEEELPDSAKLEWTRISQITFLQRRIAGKLTRSVATVNAGIAATPIPVADIAPITTMQVLLVSSIGYVSGRRLSLGAARDFIMAVGANVGAALTLREVARAFVRIIPVAGSAVSASIAYGATVGIGRTASAYFIDKQAVSDLQGYFRRATAEGQQEFKAAA